MSSIFFRCKQLESVGIAPDCRLKLRSHNFEMYQSGEFWYNVAEVSSVSYYSRHVSDALPIQSYDKSWKPEYSELRAAIGILRRSLTNVHASQTPKPAIYTSRGTQSRAFTQQTRSTSHAGSPSQYTQLTIKRPPSDTAGMHQRVPPVTSELCTSDEFL
ncbi:hypothetical protein EAI_06422 [Harpegnathos saltator]|uniref:Uncharacterized protein n=1 Tax=Harpegnathos saltator TaxID=610380 RepID=E2C1Z7_HARSA|nr:hypothetical protein EAI_06422 [Harpegnathos saltator]